MAPYNPPYGFYYSQVDTSPYDKDIIIKMIGKGGKGFYDITNYLKINYLWYNNEKNIIELWGQSVVPFRDGASEKMKFLLDAYQEIKNTTLGLSDNNERV